MVNQAVAISRLMRVPTIVEDGYRPEDRPDRLIGSGTAMQTVCKQIGRVAPQDVNVLIVGESGTGKELVARAIYHHSRRSQAPFLAINCAAIPESLLESELFGHERGAFTGADRRRIGKFEQSHGGTLLLDEIGDMAPGTQAKILRLLQENSFERLGGSEAITADVRVIAATNQDLDLLIEQGRFRKDLYYRLRGVTIHLPPCGNGGEDIAEIAHHFLFSLQPSARHRGAIDLSGGAGIIGKVRLAGQCAGVAKRDVRSADRFRRPHAASRVSSRRAASGIHRRAGSEPQLDSIPDVDWQSLSRFVDTAAAQGESDVYRRAQERFDRLVISSMMRQAGSQQNRAAEILGLSRVTLRAKLRQMQLAVAKVLAPREPEN